jgi:hypothetical protein
MRVLAVEPPQLLARSLKHLPQFSVRTNTNLNIQNGYPVQQLLPLAGSLLGGRPR